MDWEGAVGTDWNADADKLTALECWTCAWDEVAEDDAQGHGEDDPYDEKAVEKGESL